MFWNKNIDLYRNIDINIYLGSYDKIKITYIAYVNFLTRIKTDCGDNEV